MSECLARIIALGGLSFNRYDPHGSVREGPFAMSDSLRCNVSSFMGIYGSFLG